MKKYLEKIIVFEARIPLIKRFISELEKIPANVRAENKIDRKLHSYKQMLFAEEKKLQNAYEMITPRK